MSDTNNNVNQLAGTFSQIATAISQGIEGAFEHPKVAKVTPDMYVAPQLYDEDLKELAKLGAKSVVNLRFETEAGYVESSQAAKELGLQYFKFPVNGNVLTDALADKLLAVIDGAPKPVVIHCKGMIRAAGIGLMHKLTRSQLSPEALDARIRELRLEPETMESLKVLVEKYVQSKLEIASSLPSVSSVSSSLLIGPQVTEATLKSLKEKGVKTVINLRDISEAGQLGLGVLVNEEKLVKGLGMTYINIPTVAGEQVTADKAKEIADAYRNAEKPVFMHCRTMKRTKGAVEKLGDP